MARNAVVKFPVLVASLGLLWAGSALAQTADAGTQGNGKPEKTARRICRSITPSGSRLTVRRCMTQADWDKGEDKSRDGVLKFQTDNQTLLQQAARPQ